jgi:hypothetical protein
VLAVLAVRVVAGGQQFLGLLLGLEVLEIRQILLHHKVTTGEIVELVANHMPVAAVAEPVKLEVMLLPERLAMVETAQHLRFQALQ